MGLPNSIGSLWRRWDPHIHAPGTLMNDQFGGDWTGYLEALERATPKVSAIGVTDYLSIGTYKEFLRRRPESLRDVFAFPNVETRLTISTEKAASINLHLLFSPEAVDHVDQIERVLGLLQFEVVGDRVYACTDRDLEALGRKIDPRQTDTLGARSLGAQQFKVSLEHIHRLFKSDRWLQDNCLVAVSVRTGDGTSGLQNDSSFLATRRNIERFADVIFSATPSQRDFWLAKNASSREAFEAHYRGLKPCLHGCDAHNVERVARPDLERYCWIKGDLSFDTLRQVLLEPEDRVWIGSEHPAPFAASRCISDIQVRGAAWMAADHLPLNPGLVAIIGARGSGKTALLEILAAGGHAARASTAGSGSFLQKAEEHLYGTKTILTWGDGTQDDPVPLRLLDDGESWISESVCYLSQHFVERVCSSGGLGVELRREIERVIFEAIDPTNRMEADSFEQLAQTLIDPVRSRRDEITGAIRELGNDIAREQLLELSKPKLHQQRQQLQATLEKERKDLQKLVPKGQEQRAKVLADLERACSEVEARVESLNKRLQQLKDLGAEIRESAPQLDAHRVADLRRRFSLVGFGEADWKSFSSQFSGDVTAIIERVRKEVEREVKRITEEDPDNAVDKTKAPSADWPLNPLRAAREAARKEVGLDSQKQRAYAELQKQIMQREVTLRKLDAELVQANQSTARKKELVTERRKAYASLVATIVDEEKILSDLYRPLEQTIKASSDTVRRLRFVVTRKVDLEAWAEAGEDLIDLRKATAFQGHGALKTQAAGYLAKPWLSGSAEEVSAAMDVFRERFGSDFMDAKKPEDASPEAEKRWTQDLASWLYDTDHITVQYGIQYDGIPVERLSPGTRGIVLLLVYLAIDQKDPRPLLIDQPEENLDPKSVFADLVPYFRDARKRRQVIIVTHNPNLVVNTDADQIIVASAGVSTSGGLPRITYESGPLEQRLIRDQVADILEGTKRAFVDRARRYGLRIATPEEPAAADDGKQAIAETPARSDGAP
jgi:ABC-type hemin transport system ATPase subunit